MYETLRQRYQKHAQLVARKSPKMIPRFYLILSPFYYDFITSHLLPLPAASAAALLLPSLSGRDLSCLSIPAWARSNTISSLELRVPLLWELAVFSQLLCVSSDGTPDFARHVSRR